MMEDPDPSRRKFSSSGSVGRADHNPKGRPARLVTKRPDYTTGRAAAHITAGEVDTDGLSPPCSLLHQRVGSLRHHGHNRERRFVLEKQRPHRHIFRSNMPMYPQARPA